MNPASCEIQQFKLFSMVQEDGAASGSAAALRTEAEGVNDTGDRMKLKLKA